MEQKNRAGIIAYSAIMVALTAICAQITIPLFIPITLQVFAVLFAGFLLGTRWGFISIGLYVLLGIAGLPIFAQGKGGPSILASPTLGYIVAFPFAAAIAGFIFNSRQIKPPIKVTIATIIPIIIIYALGILWLMVWSRTIAGKPLGIYKALSVGVVPFIPFDIIKAILAYYLARKLLFLLPGVKK